MASRTSAKKNKIGITLNDKTLEKLETESNKLGMSKSAYISMIINKQEEGVRRIKFA